MSNNNCLTCIYYAREGICKGECGQIGKKVKNPKVTCSVGCYEKSVGGRRMNDIEKAIEKLEAEIKVNEKK